MRESRLITLLQLQKPEGLQALISTYQAYVGTIIRNITRSSLSEQDVEELTADTFFAVWQTTDKLQAGKVRAYLAAIARNKAKSRLRSLSETIPLEEEAILLETADLEQEVEHTLLSEALQDTITTLSATDRDVLIRYYYYYQRIPEIAEELQLSVSAVKVRLHRARKKLKQLADGQYGIIYITEAVAAQIEEEIEQYRENTLPAIIQIPGVSGNTGAGVNGVKKTVEQAVGSDILFGGVS